MDAHMGPAQASGVGTQPMRSTVDVVDLMRVRRLRQLSGSSTAAVKLSVRPRRVKWQTSRSTRSTAARYLRKAHIHHARADIDRETGMTHPRHGGPTRGTVDWANYDQQTYFVLCSAVTSITRLGRHAPSVASARPPLIQFLLRARVTIWYITVHARHAHFLHHRVFTSSFGSHGLHQTQRAHYSTVLTQAPDIPSRRTYCQAITIS